MIQDIIFFIFLLVWTMPFYRKAGKTTTFDKKWKWKTFLFMATIGFVGVLVIQAGLMLGVRAMGLPDVPYYLIYAFVGAALLEESAKFLISKWFIRLSGAKTKWDYLVIFGLVGIGFQVTESLGLSGGSPIAGVIRGVFCSHMFYQLFMGAFYYEYVKAKEEGSTSLAKKNLALSLTVPWFVHGIWDFPLLLLTGVIMGAGDDYMAYVSAHGTFTDIIVILMVAALVLHFTVVVKSLKAVKKAADESVAAYHAQ